jgi:phage gpG-like protein
MAQDFAVKVEGLAELRRDLRRIDPELLDEVREALKAGAQRVATRAASVAPQRSGRLAASYRAFTSGNRAGVRSTLPYAGVVEYGGTIRPRGTPIVFRPAMPITGSVEYEQERIVRDLDRGIAEAAQRTGWR